MKKISIVSIAFLIFAMALPLNVFAENGAGKEAGSGDQETEESGEEEASSDSEKADQDSGESPDEKPAEEEQPKGNDSEDTQTPESGNETQNQVSEDKEGQNAGDEQENNDSSDKPVENEKEDTVDEEAPAANGDDEQGNESSEDNTAGDDSEEQADKSEEEDFSIMKTEDEPEVDESKTSKLGHLRSGAVIYEKIGDEEPVSAEEYLHAVYFIEKQAEYNDETYYLISTQQSSEEGTIGWVKKEDMSTHDHTDVDSDSKTFLIKGTGNAYSKAWGGSKDLVYDLSNYEGQEFNVNLTKEVDSNIWYRGKLDGNTVWLHNSYVEDVPEENKDIEYSGTSKLGHLGADATIYEEIGNEDTSFDTEGYLNAVYYIKQQAEYDGGTYYLISQKPSSEEGTVGWVNAADLSTHSHVGVDRERKTFYFKGTGNAYSKAWGGSNDIVFDLSQFEDQVFNVHKTETVGSNVWYRGDFNGERIWVHESYVTEVETNNTSKLGHLHTGATIYETLGDESTSLSSEDYLKAVYYIKEQAEINNNTYYHISQKPSSENGVIGWVKAEEMSTHSHVGVDKYSKLYYVKGDGSAFSKAWGGSKDIVYDDMSQYEYAEFDVHLTEKVGNNTWYRGNLDGETVWLHSSYVYTTEVEKESTSQLGHIRSESADIYETIGVDSTSFKAGEEYTNAVYYIKMQAEANGESYYKISKQASSEEGVVGWIKAEDMSTHSHQGEDRESKTFTFNGNGEAYTKAWGGSKDFVYDLSDYEGHVFNVHKTETVGGNIWYRGDFNGKRVFVHESYVEEFEESETSKLGHLRSDSTIYGPEASFSSKDYQNAVYYIKKQAESGDDELYYLISTEPSSEEGVIGWVKADEMSVHQHQTVDKKDKQFYFSGNGSAYSKAWGGSKDLVFEDLSEYTGDTFNVHLTETVGSNTWYRGDFEGELIFVHESYVEPLEQDEITNTHYDLTLEEAWEMQEKLNPQPQTDKYRNEPAYVSSNLIEFVDAAVITGDGVNMRSEPHFGDTVEVNVNAGTILTYLDEVKGDEHVGSTKWYKVEYSNETLYVHSSLANPNGEVAKATDTADIRQGQGTDTHIFDTVPEGSTLNVTEKGNEWHKISYNTWRNAKKDEVIKHMDPTNFTDDPLLRFQFVDLSKTTGATADRLNNYLVEKGTLEGQGQAFIEAGEQYGVNELYLISHAIHETGNGTSELARGVEHNGETVYNMYGVGAVDGCAVECGAARAFNEGWFTPAEAVIGGARFIGNSYIKGENRHGTVQNTLYKMRWNPEAMDSLGEAWHQYATNMGWATNQVGSMYNLYEELGIETLNLEVPIYN